MNCLRQMPSGLSLGTLAVFLLIGLGNVSIGSVEARCGYPELPYLAQLATDLENVDLYQNWNYFEESQMVKVICESGLIGYYTNDGVLGSNSATPQMLTIEAHTYLECRNNRWNGTSLICLKSLSHDSASALTAVHIKPETHPTDASLLVDKSGSSCVDITDHQSEWLFEVKLDKESRVLPRVTLIIKNEQDGNSNSVARLENLILNHNHKANLSAEENSPNTVEEGNVEVEEAKRFMDFVYLNEVMNNTSHPKMMLLSTDELKSNDQKERVVHTAGAEFRLSVRIGSSSVNSWRDCYFNEDLAIGERNMSTEFLVFNCHVVDMLTDTVDRVEIRVRTHKGPESATIRLCGVDLFAVSNTACGKPYVPIYGLVTKTQQVNGRLSAQYSCVPGYRITDMMHEQNRGIHLAANSTDEASPIVERQCDPKTHSWTPDFGHMFCMPVHACRSPPPLSDPTKFYYEYSKLDHLGRAVGDMSVATLRCHQLTDYVMPYTSFRCSRSGQWVRLGAASEGEPVCRTAMYRKGRKPSHYYHHYYHHYYPNSATQVNSTSHTTIVFGRQLNDNKYLTYYGAAGIIILFGGSFIVLFHVRRMAKKISRQMRERAYISVEKGGGGSGSEAFMQVGNGGGNDGNLPSYYNNDSNYYDINTMYSSDLPPPATPISMPLNQSTGGKDGKGGLSSNFDSIKF